MSDDSLTSFCKRCGDPTFTFGSNKEKYCRKCMEIYHFLAQVIVAGLKIGFALFVVVMLWKIATR